MKMNKKLLAILLAGIMAVAVAGCGGSSGSSKAETQAPETEAAETAEAGGDETAAPETQAAETQAAETQAPETQAPETQATETQAPEAAATVGDEDLASVCNAAADNCTGIDSIWSQVTMDFVGTVKYSGMTLDMTMLIVQESEAILDPLTSHTTETTTMTGLGEDSVSVVEKYTETVDGVAKTYEREDDGEWTVGSADSDFAVDFVCDEDVFREAATGANGATLENELASINGKDAYVVSIPLSGDDLKDVLSESFGDVGEDFDWDAHTVLMCLYVYADNKMPASISIDVSEIGDEVMAAALGMAGQEGFEISVDRFIISGICDRFNEITSVEIPDEVRVSE